MTRRMTWLLGGLWVAFVAWPFAAWAGVSRPWAFILYPVGLSLSAWVTAIPLQALFATAASAAALSLVWRTLNLWPPLRLVIAGLADKLTLMPLSHPAAFQHYWIAPLFMGAEALVWVGINRTGRSGALLLWAVAGSAADLVAHDAGGIPVVWPLALAGTDALALMAQRHWQRLASRAFQAPRPQGHYAFAAALVLMPGSAGLLLGHLHPKQMPAAPPIGALALPNAPGHRLSGYGSGITQINHSLVLSAAPVFLVQSPVPAYWMAATYNTFTGLSWSNQGPSSVYLTSPRDRGIPLMAPYYASKVPISAMRATFRDLASTSFSTLFYTGVPTHFSVPATFHTLSQTFVADGPRQYQLTAAVPDYSLRALRDAPRAVPPPRLAVDLEVPANLSPRVGQLARRLAGRLRSPWQAAQVIKQYLDTHYRYSAAITPARVDVVNHFLFGDRKGYCDQFSTAFIMMMRTLRIPARWVVGYAAGTWDPAQHAYLVRADDAHAWAEIWIHGVGWVPIDPTPGFHLPLTLKAAPLPAHRANGHLPVAKPPIKSIRIQKSHPRKSAAPGSRRSPLPLVVHRRGLSFALAGLAGAGVLTLLWVARRHGRRPKTLPDRLFQQLVRRLGGTRPDLTPRQWGALWLQTAPDDAPLVRPLVSLLESAFYRPEPLTEAELAELRALAQNLKRRPRRRPA
ncbi:MAG: transglutaminase-like domain-containing protein [Firmicutes bacterium]|nr:transglutaminase-like domain-containing protein [Bacillota bacterium]